MSDIEGAGERRGRFNWIRQGVKFIKDGIVYVVTEVGGGFVWGRRAGSDDQPRQFSQTEISKDE